MKKIVFPFIFLISLISFSQELDSINYRIRKFDLIKSNKERTNSIVITIDSIIINNTKDIGTDTIKLYYGLFISKKGKTFITNNFIDDVNVANTFEYTFEKPLSINPFRDSITKVFKNHYIRGTNSYFKKNDSYVLIPVNKNEHNFQKKLESEKHPKYIVIENVPIYPGCKGDNKELKNCMSKKISRLIAISFNIDLANNLGLSPGLKRIFAQFVINKEGFVIKAKARGPHVVLEKEVERVLRKIPKMISPGKQNGKPVNVNYTIPVVFHVEKNKRSKSKRNKRKNRRK